MARYMCTWETRYAAWPTDIQERMGLAKQLLNDVKTGMEEGWIKDWGHYMGGNGYWILEGNDSKEVVKKMTPYSPYFTFYVQEVLTVDDTLALYP